jgi:hypothetical protein
MREGRGECCFVDFCNVREVVKRQEKSFGSGGGKLIADNATPIRLVHYLPPYSSIIMCHSNSLYR